MKKNVLSLLFSRMVLVSLGILLQLAVLFATVYWFSGVAREVNIALTVMAFCMVLYILSGRSNYAYKMAWIMVILVAPVFGLFLYIMFGGNRLSKRLKRKMADMEKTLTANLPQEQAVLDVLNWHDPEAAVQARYISATAHCPVYQNTETSYFSSGETAYAAMLQELEKARCSIYLEYFIIAEGEMWQSILNLLQKKAAQGVDVRVIYDDFGCISRLPNHYDRILQSMGIRACCFNRYVPVLNSRLNNRDHRKFLVIDGQTAFTGGLNLADEYINRCDRGVGRWKDCAVMLRGDAVRSVTVMFLAMWNHISGDTAVEPAPEPEFHPRAAGYVQPYTDSPLDFEATGRTVFLNMIARANRRVWIMTPYLIIDDAMAETLSMAAKSGLDVRIITPGIGDKAYVHELSRANYAPLVEDGVGIYEYRPGFVHSKLFLADDDFGVVGTVNLDFRSLYLHFEDGVWLYRANCVKQIREDFEQTFPQCRRITLADCRRVGFFRRLYRSVLRLLSPLM